MINIYVGLFFLLKEFILSFWWDFLYGYKWFYLTWTNEKNWILENRFQFCNCFLRNWRQSRLKVIRRTGSVILDSSYWIHQIGSVTLNPSHCIRHWFSALIDQRDGTNPVMRNHFVVLMKPICSRVLGFTHSFI